MKIPYYSEFITDIQRINNIRNIFAHCSPGSLDGGLIFYNKNKKRHETKKLEEFHKEFITKIKKVENQLNKSLNKLIKKNIKVPQQQKKSKKLNVRKLLKSISGRKK